MKKLILVMMTAFSFNAFAAQVGAFNLSKDDIALVPIDGTAQVEVQGFVFPHCPMGAMCEPMSKINLDLNFRLMGCVDTLGPVTYTYDRSEDGKKVTVYVSALNVVNKRSEVTKCFVAPMARKQLELKMSSGVEQAQVVFLHGEE